jgi:hypothetical protein
MDSADGESGSCWFSPLFDWVFNMIEDRFAGIPD